MLSSLRNLTREAVRWHRKDFGHWSHYLKLNTGSTLRTLTSLCFSFICKLRTVIRAVVRFNDGKRSVWNQRSTIVMFAMALAPLSHSHPVCTGAQCALGPLTIPETWEGLWSQNYFHNNETLYFPFWLTLSHKSTNPYSGISQWLLYATWYCDRLKAEANWESNYHLLSQTLKDLQKSLLVMPFSSQKMLEVWKLVTFHKKLHECVLVFKNKLVLNFFLF